MSLFLRTRGLSLKFDTLLLTVLVSFEVQADLPPYSYAQTSSNTNITAIINQGVNLQNKYAFAQLKTGAVSISMLPGDPALIIGPSIHKASSSANLYIPNNSAPINFSTSYSTQAQSLTLEPLFSKAGAFSFGSVESIVTPTTNSQSPMLNLSWNFSSLNMQTKSTASFAYFSDVVNIKAPGSTNSAPTTVGFSISMESGKVTATVDGPSGISTTIAQWLNNNLDITTNQVSLITNPTSLSVTISLNNLSQSINELPNLVVQNLHQEYSIEAPPAAAKQVDQKAGNPAENGATTLSWNVKKETLKISPIAIDLSGKYANDPLNGGFLKIDPLALVSEKNGRRYFSGGTLSLFDKNKARVFEANLPNLVFDESANGLQGFDLFGPILHILEAKTDESRWLYDYMSKINIDSLLLPELFIGIDPISTNGSSIWNTSFSTPAKAFLSFSGIATVPEPRSIYLIVTGLFMFIFIMSRNRKAIF